MMVPSRARRRSAPSLNLIWFALLPSNLSLVSCEESKHGDIFVPIDPDDKYWQKEIPFDPSWLEDVGGKASDGELPLSHLRPPDFIDVYDFALPVESSESSVLNKTCSDTEEKEEECATSPDASSEPHTAMNATATSLAATATSKIPSPLQIGEAARRMIDESMAKSNTSGVLLRNMHRIKTAEDFAEFWRGCTSASSSTIASPSSTAPLCGEDGECDDDCNNDTCKGSGNSECKTVGEEGWTPREFSRHWYTTPWEKLSGIDIVRSPNGGPKILMIHNEMAGFDPFPPSKEGFFCLQDAAWGGESLLASNAAITTSISKEILDYVKEHGGVRYSVKFGDRNQKRTPEGRIWQDLCGVETQDEAVECFQRIGCDEDKIVFDRKGTAEVSNTVPGFRRNPTTDTDIWFSMLHLYAYAHGRRAKATLGDGSSLPMEMFQQLQFDMFKALTVVKLNPGDFLIWNNYEAMHGRLPFGNTEEKKRALLSVYTK